MHSPHQNHPRNAEDLRDPGQELPRTTRSSFERFELGRLVKVWSDSGAALPVAVVVSIFDDLCESLGGPALDDIAMSRWSHPLALDQVVIDQQGIARLTVTPSEPVSAVSRLLYDTLSAGQGELGVPAAARPLLEHGMAHDPWLRPSAPETLQRWLRTSLGPPAGREEVRAACAVLPKEDPALIEIPSLVGPAMTGAPRAVVTAVDVALPLELGPPRGAEDRGRRTAHPAGGGGVLSPSPGNPGAGPRSTSGGGGAPGGPGHARAAPVSQGGATRSPKAPGGVLADRSRRPPRLFGEPAGVGAYRDDPDPDRGPRNHVASRVLVPLRRRPDRLAARPPPRPLTRRFTAKPARAKGCVNQRDLDDG